MNDIYLFDWGDTLMVDFLDQNGKMCDWIRVQAVDGAAEVLQMLAENHKIYVATNAADSSEEDIKAAFERVGLSSYISGYFCKANLGIGKGSPGFFHKIVDLLQVTPHSIVMVGDTYNKDIHPAVRAGIRAIWFNPDRKKLATAHNISQIHHLAELCL